MNTAQAILYSTLIFAVSSDFCDKTGGCVTTSLKELDVHDSFDCWKECVSYDGCNYATFAVPACLFETHNCALKGDCGFFLPDVPCLTSSRECAHCDFNGLCIVSTNLAYFG